MLLKEPTAEALDEWKLFVAQSVLDEIEMSYPIDAQGSALRQIKAQASALTKRKFEKCISTEMK